MTEPESCHSIQQALAAGGFNIQFAGVTMRPKNTVAVEGESAKRLLALLDALEDHDDVQNVYANLDISEEALEAIQN